MSAEAQTGLDLQTPSAEAPPDVSPSSQWVPFECVCGKKCGAYLAHFQLVRCGGCHAFWWALQPRRRGRLVAFLWPGLPDMAAGVLRAKAL